MYVVMVKLTRLSKTLRSEAMVLRAGKYIWPEVGEKKAAMPAARMIIFFSDGVHIDQSASSLVGSGSVVCWGFVFISGPLVTAGNDLIAVFESVIPSSFSGLGASRRSSPS